LTGPTPGVPQPQSLGNGIHSIPAPLPFRSPPWVNTYAIESGDGLLLVDCGTDWEPGHAALLAGFASLGLDPTAVHTLVVSHLHPDHVGLSSRLREGWGCVLVMHQRAARLVERYNDTEGFVERLTRVGTSFGLPAPTLESIIEPVRERPGFMGTIDSPDRLVEDGDRLDLGNGRELEVIHTPGHESAHICLRDSLTGILFSGDHVLPRISPVIMWDEGLGDPLGDYLGSLRRMLGMGIGLTYPAHGTIIARGDDRMRQLVLHHDRRLLDMIDLVRVGDTTAWEVMVKSFRPNLGPIDTRLAFLETVSHLEHLRMQGRVHSREQDGVFHYLR
jgi:glyoxylase-like metal-dependent hydrolase (beta-lactamase superfamily II)